MGSKGGGSAGQVSYPDYLMTLHSSLLSHGGIDEPVYSGFSLLNESHLSSPFSTAISYTGRLEVGTLTLSVASALGEILAQNADAYATLHSRIVSISSQIQSLFNPATIQASLTTDRDQSELETQRLMHKHAGRSVQNGTVFSSSYITGRSRILDAKMRSLLASGTEKLSAAFLQLSSSKHTNTMDLIEEQWQNFRITNTAYMLSVELCKMAILNEREHTEQAQFYAKYSAHWEFERVQAVCNDMAMLQMGKKLTFVASPDAPKWMNTAAWFVTTPVNAYTFSKSKKDRYVALNSVQYSGTGYSMGGWVGAIIGGIAGAGIGLATYSEGEWR